MNTLSVQQQNVVATITLARPEVHNAFNGEMIRELTEAFETVGADPQTRIVILASEGKSFCAGADLNWMRAVAGYTFEENAVEATRLGRMLQAVATCPKPVIGRIQGPAFGGGVGLAAACDLTGAVERAVFSLSEVKLGLIPAVIAPFILRKMPPGTARRYFLTAERILAAEARQIGLVSEVVPDPGDLDAIVDGWVRQLAANAPGAMADCKRLLDELTRPALEEVLPLTAQYNAERRASAEGQEGMKAFLEKRPPYWISDFGFRISELEANDPSPNPKSEIRNPKSPGADVP